MIDLDYENKCNDYIVEIFYGYEEDFYIGIKYKDDSVIKVPFTIRNYNILCLRLEKQYNEPIKRFLSYKDRVFGLETLRTTLDVLFLIFINSLFYSEDKFLKYCFLMISGITFIKTTGKRGYKLVSSSVKEYKKVKIIDFYLKNKENFLIELANGEFTYGLNIANINGDTKEMPYNEEIKGQMKLLKYIAEKENSRDGLNG